MMFWKKRKPKPSWKRTHWRLPTLHSKSVPVLAEDKAEIDQLGHSLELELKRLGQPASIVRHFRSASYDNFMLRPKGKVKPILNLSLDLSVALGKLVTIEANCELIIRIARTFRDTIRLDPTGTQALTVNLGQAITGGPVLLDIAQAPHVLIAGATGSGKSVCINALLVNLLLTNTPQTLQLTLIDLKRVELSAYQKLPHLLEINGFITETDRAAEALAWSVVDMERRYLWLQANSYRSVEGLEIPRRLIIIDELADLVEHTSLSRIAQKGRAAGIHLIVATQRPSVDILKGPIKANLPVRIAFKTASQVDSRVILDRNGAESLLGKGDFIASIGGQFIRGQGAFTSDKTIKHLVNFWKGQI